MARRDNELDGDALPVLKVVTARAGAGGDCAICCLAMILDCSYEDVLAVAVDQTTDAGVHFKGLWVSQIIKIAKALGVTLHRRRKWDLETGCGIVGLCNMRTNEGHVVVLKNGMIFDVDGTVWEAGTYLANSKYQVECLLTLT